MTGSFGVGSNAKDTALVVELVLVHLALHYENTRPEDLLTEAI